MSIKDRLFAVINKFKQLSKPKKFLVLLIIAIIVVGILISVDVIPKEYIFPATIDTTTTVPQPEIPEISNEIVKGYFRGGGGCVADVESQQVPAESIEACREIGRNLDGVIAVGFRNDNHTTDSLKNTCFFYKCIASDYDKNDPMHTDDIYHTMSCVNDAEVFEDCV